MKNYYKIILVFFSIIWIYVHVITIDRLLKDKSELTSNSGLIEYQQLIRTSGKGNNKAVVLKLRNQDLQYAVHDKYERAFKFLSENRVQNQTAEIFYDSDGYNSNDNLTFHIYKLTIGNQELLEMEEAKSTERIGILILLGFDILFIFFYLWIRKKLKSIETVDMEASV